MLIEPSFRPMTDRSIVSRVDAMVPAIVRNSAMRAVIVSVARLVLLANCLTSAATTANPRPASPARAASMVAFSASRLVWLATLWIRLVTWPI